MHYPIEQTARPGDAARTAGQVPKWRQNETTDPSASA